MDTQIWYAIYATLLGVIVGAVGHLGEVSGICLLQYFILNLFNPPPAPQPFVM